jgi:CO/xanthine dehydrogenase Mo-binding subunit
MNAPDLPQSLKTTPRLDRWMRFNADRTVTVFSGKVELGQGIETAIAQIAAEELDVPLERLELIAGDTTLTPNEGYTSGSQSIEVGGRAMRLACAEVRKLFLDAAAREFEVSVQDLRVHAGIIEVPGTDLRTSYWELAPRVDLARDAVGTAAPKSPSQYTIMGKSAPRRDIRAKLSGAAYVHDMELPGMVFGRVCRPPSYQAKLKRFDPAAVKALPGIVAVVVSGDFIGVCAEREEQAINALKVARAAAVWEERAALPETTEVREFLPRLPSKSNVVQRNEQPVGQTVKRLEAAYSKPYIAHAAIGPSCALAQYLGERLTVWSHTQGSHHLRDQIAKVLGMPVDNVHVVHRDGAGCYGHNGADDAALDAVLLARACGRPVLLQWTREDELAWSPYGSAMVVRLAAALDTDGRIVDWRHEVWSHTHSQRPGSGEGINLLAAWHMEPPLSQPPARDVPPPAGGGIRNAVPLYDFPRQEIVYNFIAGMPLRVSALRSLGAYANIFSIESFMDELAIAAGVDPVEFRLRHIERDARARAVIEAAAKLAGWTHAETGDGTRGRGFGFARYKNASAYCAVVAAVEVSEIVRVNKVYAAVDAGQVINPDGLKNQIEGGIVQAISWTLKEEVKWDRERVLARSWESYPVLRFGEVPEVEVLLLDRPGSPSLGAGECAAGPTAAAIANALYRAMGVRARDLPLTPERIAQAMD